MFQGHKVKLSCIIPLIRVIHLCSVITLFSVQANATSESFLTQCSWQPLPTSQSGLQSGSLFALLLCVLFSVTFTKELETFWIICKYATLPHTQIWLFPERLKFHWLSPFIWPIPVLVLSTYVSINLLKYSGSFPWRTLVSSIHSTKSSTRSKSFLWRDFHGSPLDYPIMSCQWSMVDW